MNKAKRVMSTVRTARTAQTMRTTCALLSALALAGMGVGGAQAQTTTTVTRTVNYEYDAYGQLKKETVQPDDPALRVSTEYARAAVGGVDFGLVSAKTVTWLDPVSGTTQSRVVQSTGYDARGRFALTQTNAKSQTVTSTYDETTGAVLTMVDPNQLTTSWEYDAWGRKLRENRPDDTVTSWMYQGCIDSCGWATAVTVTQQWGGAGLFKSQIAVPKEDFTDRLGRMVQSRTWGFDGTPVITQTAFTAQGYTASVARPRFQGAAPVWTFYDRDDIGRVNKIRSPAPDGSGYAETAYTYSGRVLSMVNAKGQSRIEERNVLGKLKSATDALGKVTTYVYDGFGNLVRTRDPKGNEIAIGYDALGRKTSLQDPDVGSVTYWVDPLGQTWKQRDAKAQDTLFSFDELGRMVRRLEPDQDSRWEYDTAFKGVGKLAESYTWVNGAKDVRRAMTYDAKGRPSTTVVSLDWDYLTQTSYDGFGRANVQSYTRRTRGATGGGVTTAIVNAFNAMGYVDKTYRRSDGVDTLVWTGLQIDAEGRDTRQQIGTGAVVVHGYNPSTGRLESIVSGADANGSVNATLQNDVYQYDVLGNLAYRAQLNGAGTLLQESFEYDELNRLKAAHLNGQTQNFAYDALGNITSKANVGTYAYPESGIGSTRPHAVSTITGNVAGLTNPSFSYDGNGNLLNGLNRAYTWSAADQPVTIEKLSNGQAVQRTEFLYGPDHERVRQIVRTMSGGQPQAMVNTVVYAGAIEKEIDVEKGVTIIRTSLGADGYVEERIAGTAIDANTAGTRNGRLFLKDHLGSVIGIVDEAGQLQQRMNYDAWGRRRNADGSDDSWATLGTIKNDQDNSGYTGHEQLDQLGLVHMNARLYDPITGRHVSADPTIPDPKDQQAFNRFSYVLNNALVYTDPTGLSPEGAFVVFQTLSNQFMALDQTGSGSWGCVLWKCRPDQPKRPLPDEDKDGEKAKKGDKKPDRPRAALPPALAMNSPGGPYQEPTWSEIAVGLGIGAGSAIAAGTAAELGAFVYATGAELIAVGPVVTYLSNALAYNAFGLSALEVAAGVPVVTLSVASAAKGSLEGANFAQKTFGSMFSKGGAFAGRSVDDVAAALRSGAMKPSEVPIDFIVRDGSTLILNTRSAQALEMAGVPRSAWNAVNRTGQETFESMLSGQLQRNGLTSDGIATVRRSGGP